MSNAAMQAEKWYLDNADNLKGQFKKVGFRADRVDPIRGAISIELKSRQPSQQPLRFGTKETLRSLS